jgi:hypothetical protein
MHFVRNHENWLQRKNCFHGKTLENLIMMNLLCVITLWVTCAQTQILAQKFEVQENKKVVFQNTGTIIRRAGSQIICAAACFHHDTCCVASYDNALQSCHMDTSGSCLVATEDSVGWTVLQSITGMFQFTMLKKIRNDLEVLRINYYLWYTSFHG